MRHPIRVALIHYRDHPGGGGSVRVGQNLASHLNPQTTEAHLIFAYGGPGPVSQNTGVTRHFLASRGPQDVRAWIRARNLIQALKPDILHFIDPVVWLHAALAGGSCTRLMHVHGQLMPRFMRWRDRILWRWLSTRLDGWVCITAGARRSLLELKLAREDRAWVVYNGVDCRRLSALPPRPRARAALGLPGEARVLGMVTRFVRDRGISDAIRLLKMLGRRWHLLLCGGGPYLSEIQRLTTEADFGARVHFTGYLSDVGPAYAAMDAFLFLARYDSFGLATCEAMASGVPVFGLAGEGEYREVEYPLITPENAVFLERSKPGDYETVEPVEIIAALGVRLEEFARFPQVYQPMIENARAWVCSRFGAFRQARGMEGIYRRLVNGN